MTRTASRFHIGALVLSAALATALAGCAPRQTGPPPGTQNPDQFLFDRATAEMQEENYANARTYFQQVVDNYPQSPLRADSKLGVGDAYLEQGGAENLILAANEFREFLSFFPTNPRADYAQYRLAMTHFAQMRAPERDQTETRNALREFDVFFTRFPNSALMPEVKENWRIARDRLSESSLRVGIQYYRQRWWPGAIDRFREVLNEDAGFTGKDRLYFYLADALARQYLERPDANADKRAEAIPYFERLLAEYPMSELRADAEMRLQQLRAQ
jgi:outer membrane protein assembly factor BamD